MEPIKKEDISQEVFDLYDDYAHNKIDRKEALKEDEFREVLQLPYHMTKGKDATQ